MPSRSGSSAAPAVAATAILAVAWAAVALFATAEVAFDFFLASRIAYVTFVGLALRAQDEGGWWTRQWGPEGGYLRFRRAASLVMNNDGVSLVLVCWATRGTLRTAVDPGLIGFLGAALVVVGVGMKAWAVATLGRGSFYWRSFFVPQGRTAFKVSGPYRWFANPMYTVGYAHAYGLALLLRSVPGLIAALVAQVLILLLNHWAERPHTERMRTGAATAEAAE